MSESRVLLDPTSEQKPAKRERVDRPASLEGLTVGLLDISKNRGDVFLDRVESHLAGRGLAVKRSPVQLRIPAVPPREASNQAPRPIESRRPR